LLKNLSEKNRKAMKGKDFFSLGNRFDRIALAIYLIWILLNILLLGNGLTSGSAIDHAYFFPFYAYHGYYFAAYDLSEFTFYVLAPVFIFIVIKLIQSGKNETK